MSTATVQQLTDVLLAAPESVSPPDAAGTLGCCWNNRKCGVSEGQFPLGKEFL